MKTLLCALFFAVLAGDLPRADKVRIEKVAEVPGYSEGVVFDQNGNGYISDVLNGTIYRIDAAGQASAWAKTGAPNGHKILADGTHLVCDGSRHAVLRLSATGEILGKAASECEGKPLRAPNDLTLDPRGGFYFTDPGGSDEKNRIGTVHYVDANGKTHLVAEGLAFPNGIVLRPDADELLVAESKFNHILAYEVLAPGKVGAKKVFAKLPEKSGEQIDNQPDGMCLDREGNLYVAHYGMRQVQALNRKGEVVRRYPGGNLTTSNVAFGGPKLDQLYITGALGEETTTPGGLFRLDLKGVAGLRLLRQ